MLKKVDTAVLLASQRYTKWVVSDVPSGMQEEIVIKTSLSSPLIVAILSK